MAAKTDTMLISSLNFSLIKLNKSIRTAYLLGGKSVLSKAVEDQIKAYGIQKIVRIGGKDAYETSALITRYLKLRTGSPAIVVSNKTPAALVKAVIGSNKNNYAIIYTSANSLNAYAKKTLKSLKPSKIYIAGDLKALSASEEKSISSIMSHPIRIRTAAEAAKLQ